MSSDITQLVTKYRQQITRSRVLAPLSIALTTLILQGKPAQALTFNFMPPPPGTDQQAYDGFVAAGALWSNIFTDNVTVNLSIGFRSLDPGVLAEAGSVADFYSYTDVRNALFNDRTSADDVSAVDNLQASPFSMLINLTENNPNGSGSITPYLDNDGDDNNQFINMSRANAKALGLVAGDAPEEDAMITFSSNFAFDFDRSDGISARTFDFIGIAAHEIGHALGFLSGVDVLDYFSQSENGGPYQDNDFTFVTPLDLFRYSTASQAQGPGVIDWTADLRDKYFSLDGGTTPIGIMNPLQGFSTGTFYGDGNQASHWKDDLGRGIMDPTFDYEELGLITELDRRGFDAIGWNRRDAAPIPTPALLPGLIGLGIKMMRKRHAII
jgi:hypothetical protein